jgi:hypothetical protein
MKTNELRLGNYLYGIINQEIDRGNGIIEDFEKCEVVKVIGFDPFENIIWCDSELDIENYDLQPIPLTEEWLERFGFAFYFFSGTYAKNGIKIVSENTFWCLNVTGIIITIKHVHQLQNLYFALTGEELQIKQQ